MRILCSCTFAISIVLAGCVGPSSDAIHQGVVIQGEHTYVPYDGGVESEDAGGIAEPTPYPHDPHDGAYSAPDPHDGGDPNPSGYDLGVAPNPYSDAGGSPLDAEDPVYHSYDGATGGAGDAGGGGGQDAGGGGGQDAGGGGGQDAGGGGGDGGACGGTVTTSGLCIQTAQVTGTVSSSPTGTTSIATQLGGPGTSDWCLRFIARGDNGDFGTGGTWTTPITFSCSGSGAYIGCHITSSAQAASTPSCPEGCTAGPVTVPGCSGARDVSLQADLSSGPWTINPQFLDPDAWRSSKGYWFRQDQEYCDAVYNQIRYSAGAACVNRANEKAQAACDAQAPSQLDIPVTYTCQ